MNLNTKNPITAKGKALLTERLHRIKKYQEVVIDEISEARKKGDLSENFEYHAAKKRNNELSRHISQLEQYLCSVFTPTPPPGVNRVCFGVKVVLKNMQNNAEVSYIVVGDKEASPENGSIGFASHLFDKIKGQKAGFTFELNSHRYEILSVAPASSQDLEACIPDTLSEIE